MNNTNTAANANQYGFVGINYLVEKYKCPSEYILHLFIECEYSIQRTVELLEQRELAA